MHEASLARAATNETLASESGTKRTGKALQRQERNSCLPQQSLFRREDSALFAGSKWSWVKRRGGGGLGSRAEEPLGSESISAEGGEVETGECTRQRLRSVLGSTALEAWVRRGGRSFQVSPKSQFMRPTTPHPHPQSQSVCLRVLKKADVQEQDFTQSCWEVSVGFGWRASMKASPVFRFWLCRCPTVWPRASCLISGNFRVLVPGWGKPSDSGLRIQEAADRLPIVNLSSGQSAGTFRCCRVCGNRSHHLPAGPPDLLRIPSQQQA